MVKKGRSVKVDVPKKRDQNVEIACPKCSSKHPRGNTICPYCSWERGKPPKDWVNCPKCSKVYPKRNNICPECTWNRVKTCYNNEDPVQIRLAQEKEAKRLKKEAKRLKKQTKKFWYNVELSFGCVCAIITFGAIGYALWRLFNWDYFLEFACFGIAILIIFGGGGRPSGGVFMGYTRNVGDGDSCGTE